MYNAVLIPVDGSNTSNEALTHGIDLAQKYDATVHLAYILDSGFRGRYHEVADIGSVEKAIERSGEQALNVARERVERSSLPVEVHVKHAIPHRGIVELSQEINADIIVMGTVRREGDCQNLIGSATERVVRMSVVPVIVVKTEPVKETKVRIRGAIESDREDVQSIAIRSMKASYHSFLPETDIWDAAEQWYGPDQFGELISDPETILLVAEQERGTVGFSQGHLIETPRGLLGEIHWLHVDPEHRDKGIGRDLFDQMRGTLEEKGTEQISAFVLAEYDHGNAFYRAVGLAPIDSRTVQVGEQSFEERVYVDLPPGTDRNQPQVESRTSKDGEELFVDYEETEIGSKAPFFAVYTSRDLDIRYGWFCSNCETFDTAMDTMGRIVCNRCGNHHKATRWDAVVTE